MHRIATNDASDKENKPLSSVDGKYVQSIYVPLCVLSDLEAITDCLILLDGSCISSKLSREVS